MQISSSKRGVYENVLNLSQFRPVSLPSILNEHSLNKCNNTICQNHRVRSLLSSLTRTYMLVNLLRSIQITRDLQREIILNAKHVAKKNRTLGHPGNCPFCRVAHSRVILKMGVPIFFSASLKVPKPKSTGSVVSKFGVLTKQRQLLFSF